MKAGARAPLLGPASRRHSCACCTPPLQAPQLHHPMAPAESPPRLSLKVRMPHRDSIIWSAFVLTEKICERKSWEPRGCR